MGAKNCLIKKSKKNENENSLHEGEDSKMNFDFNNNQSICASDVISPPEISKY
jgi:hypothetical protein